MSKSTEEYKGIDSGRDTINDLIRVVAMFLVIGVHWFGSLVDYCPQEGLAIVALNFISKLTRLGVPIFFSLSGYYILGKEITNIKDFYYKRFVRVVVPYLIYAVFYVFYFSVFEDHEPVMLLKNYIVNVLTGNVHGTHWFVYSILGLYFATPFLSRMFKALSDKEVMVLYITALSLGMLNCIFGLFGSRFGINTYVFQDQLLTFISGYCMQRCLNVLQKKKHINTVIYRLLLITALFVLFCFTEWDICLCIIAGLAVAGNTEQSMCCICGKVVALVSRYSYSVYLAHAAVISAVLQIYRGWSGNYFGLKAFVGYIAVFGASFTFALVFDTLCTNRVIKALSNRKTRQQQI